MRECPNWRRPGASACHCAGAVSRMARSANHRLRRPVLRGLTSSQLSSSKKIRRQTGKILKTGVWSSYTCVLVILGILNRESIIARHPHPSLLLPHPQPLRFCCQSGIPSPKPSNYAAKPESGVQYYQKCPHGSPLESYSWATSHTVRLPLHTASQALC